jgi:hypothetical protein
VYFAGEHRLDDGLLLLAPVLTTDSNAVAEAKIRVVARFFDVWAYRRLWASRNLTKPALKATFIALARDIRELSLEELTARLYAELTKPGVDNFETAPPSLSGSTRRKVHRLLARLTSFVEIHGGAGTDPYADLVVVSGRSRFDIEHIWPNRFGDYEDLFETPAEFADYRNRLGSLLLIPHSFNTSYNAMTVEAKLPMYGRSDHHLLVASLAKATYERNPSFRNWTSLTGLEFKPYEGQPFTKQSSAERTDLYRSLAQSIWAPERVIEDSNLDPKPSSNGRMRSARDSSPTKARGRSGGGVPTSASACPTCSRRDCSPRVTPSSVGAPAWTRQPPQSFSVTATSDLSRASSSVP